MRGRAAAQGQYGSGIRGDAGYFGELGLCLCKPEVTGSNPSVCSLGFETDDATEAELLTPMGTSAQNGSNPKESPANDPASPEKSGGRDSAQPCGLPGPTASPFSGPYKQEVAGSSPAPPIEGNPCKSSRMLAQPLHRSPSPVARSWPKRVAYAARRSRACASEPFARCP
jgi:hypothetical protein